MAEKENRCWPGYEPVKGKAQHEQGSCRPKAESNTTPAQKKVRASRRAQLDKWEEEHPNSRKSASQHLHAPGTKKAPAKKKGAKKSTTKPKGAKKAASKTSAKKTSGRKTSGGQRTMAKKRASASRP